jgi:hypothetical protein
MTTTERVYVRYLLAKTARLNPGDSVEKGSLRLHRFMDSLVLWDLTNAGKRGKRVEKTVVIPKYTLGSDIDRRGLLDRLGQTLEHYSSYARARGYISDYLKDYPNDLEIHEYQERGVDVTPAGFKPLVIRTDKILIEADYDGFRIVNRSDQYNEPTCIPAATGGKKSIPVFYRWVQDNESRIKRMTFYEVQNEMQRLGIKYHYYCAID